MDSEGPDQTAQTQADLAFSVLICSENTFLRDVGQCFYMYSEIPSIPTPSIDYSFKTIYYNAVSIQHSTYIAIISIQHTSVMAYL